MNNIFEISIDGSISKIQNLIILLNETVKNHEIN